MSKFIAARTQLLHRLSDQVIKVEKPVLFTGPGSSLQLAKVLPFHGYKKIFITTDKILVELGVIEPIVAELSKAGVDSFVFDEVEPDPTDTLVYRARDLFHEHQCDCVLAVGGGSSIDAGKLVACLANNKKLSVEDLGSFVKIKRHAKPIFAIPTTSGTGSEVSPAAVVSNSESHEKTIITSPGMMPLGAAIDSNIIVGMPKSVTAFTGMDAMTHAIEAYISKSASRESDIYAKAAIVIINEQLPLAYKDGKNVEARELMGIAAFYAGYAFSKAFLGYVHSISHRLSKHYGTPHGLANALVLPHVLEFSLKDIEAPLAELAEATGINTGSDAKKARAFVDRIFALNAELGIPPTLDKLAKDDIPEIAQAALAEANFIYAVPRYMSQKECEEVVAKLLP
jgi:alcohol dehydrogenase